VSQKSSHAAETAGENLGVLVVTKFRTQYATFLLSLAALAWFALAGCGGGSKTNVVTVNVSGPSSVIVSQSVTFTAIITGSTNTDVSGWTCEYTTTVVTAGKPTTSNKNPCNADTGNIPASGNTNTTVIFTAPSKVPDLTKLPGNNCGSSQQACFLSIIITATSAADTKKTGSATLALDSGIVVTLSPGTATVPTNEQQQFNHTVINDLQNQGVTWLVTQGTPTTTAPYPSLATCSPGCGAIDDNGKYTAPGTVPTTATLTVVAASKSDATRFAIATVIVIQGGPITFNSISPTIAPQGATFYDIYLDAPFISSASVITLKKQSDNSVTTIDSSSGQVKVLFPIPTASTINPASTGARLRLTVNNLAAADTYTISVSDPAQTVTPGSGPFSLSVVPVRPTSVASIPDSVPQNGQSNDLRLAVNGGYFGPTGLLASAIFNGNALLQDSTVASSSRQLNLTFPSSAVNSSLPGLYPLSVSRTTPPLPSPNNPSVTNVAVFPDYSAVPPSVGSSFGAGSGPSAMEVDAKLGILAVAETGSNLVQFFGIGDNLLTPLPCPTVSCAVNAPTGLSINQTNHTVAVVSPQDQSVVVLPLPGSTGAPGVTYPLTISLAGLISPADVVPLPLPYSVGVDPDTNMAIVAYSSSATPTTAKVGFLLDLNKDSQSCLSGAAQSTPPCPHAQVTLNTGPYPQVAMVPHSHLAYVTPGGAGTINGIDVTKPSAQLAITNVSVTSGLVTVTVDVPSGQTLGLNPGNPGTVLIQGVPPGTSNNTNFNGVFTVQSVLNSSSFTYALNSTVNDTAAGDADSTVYFSSPNITVAISQTAQGIAINPITRTAAIADANATGAVGSPPQIDLLNSLDQSVTSITFHAGCTIYTTSCPNAPELLGTSSVAFQPYINALVSYNPQQNQVSISNPVNLRRYALVCASASACQVNPTVPSQITLPGTGTGSVTFTPAGASAAVTLNLFGAVAVDPATNQAFVAQSGSGTILVVNLGPTPSTTLKAAEITELQVPTVSGAVIGGIAGALMPQGTLTSSSDLANVQIFGSGFDSGTQVRLDGTALPSGNVQLVSSRILKLTIPASFLARPRRYAVDVLNGSGVRSNVTDFLVIKTVDLKTACSGGNPQPSSVAVADQLPGQAFAPIAVVSNSGCDNVAVVDINPASPTFGAVKSTIATGTDPLGVAVSPRFGLAVVANSTDGTVSILDLKTATQKVAAVTVGASPTGVAINEGTGAALVTNTGSDTVSEINLALLFGSSPATSLTPISIAVDVSPIAVAIDPDRGTNSRGLAVVSAVQLISGSSPIGVLDALDIGGSAPARSTSAQVGTVTATPTGLVFDPSVSPALFYASSSGGNVITSFNPDGSTFGSSVHVGINPTSLAINPQTGAIMTINSTSQTVSIVDTLANSFKTRRTFGLGGSPQFGIAIDQFLNMAVLADQANNRLLIFPMPN
jgi:DNA-binding beta-propeller fold protein YncE